MPARSRHCVHPRHARERVGPAAVVQCTTDRGRELPDAVDEVPADFPAAVLWRFRLSAPAVQTTLGAGFGLVFGALAERLLDPGPETAAATARPVAAPH